MLLQITELRQMFRVGCLADWLLSTYFHSLAYFLQLGELHLAVFYSFNTANFIFRISQIFTLHTVV